MDCAAFGEVKAEAFDALLRREHDRAFQKAFEEQWTDDVVCCRRIID